MKAWHRSLIACLISLGLLYLFGAKDRVIWLLAIYLVIIPVAYILEKKKHLPLWQKRIIAALIVYPLFSLVIPLDDILIFFMASLAFSLLLLIGERFKNEKENEDIPLWDGEDNQEKK